MDALLVVVTLAARWLLAVVLIAAGIAKLGRSDNLSEVISRYDLLPDQVVAPLAAVLPIAELLLGVFLAAGLAFAPTAIVCACIFGLFAATVAISLVRGKSFNCGCGLGTDSNIGWLHVARNAVFLGLSALVAVQPALLAISVSPVRGAPGARELLAVPLGVLLLCMTWRLVRPLHDTFVGPIRQRLARSTSISGAEV